MVEKPPSLAAFVHQGVRGGGLRVRGGPGARGGGGRNALGARVPAEARQVLLADRQAQVIKFAARASVVHALSFSSLLGRGIICPDALLERYAFDFCCKLQKEAIRKLLHNRIVS